MVATLLTDSAVPISAEHDYVEVNKLLWLLTVTVYMLIQFGYFDMNDIAIVVLRIVRESDLVLVAFQWRHPVVVLRVADIFSLYAKKDCQFQPNKIGLKLTVNSSVI